LLINLNVSERALRNHVLSGVKLSHLFSGVEFLIASLIFIKFPSNAQLIAACEKMRFWKKSVAEAEARIKTSTITPTVTGTELSPETETKSSSSNSDMALLAHHYRMAVLKNSQNSAASSPSPPPFSLCGRKIPAMELEGTIVLPCLSDEKNPLDLRYVKALARGMSDLRQIVREGKIEAYLAKKNGITHELEILARNENSNNPVINPNPKKMVEVIKEAGHKLENLDRELLVILKSQVNAHIVAMTNVVESWFSKDSTKYYREETALNVLLAPYRAERGEAMVTAIAAIDRQLAVLQIKANKTWPLKSSERAATKKSANSSSVKTLVTSVNSSVGIHVASNTGDEAKTQSELVVVTVTKDSLTLNSFEDEVKAQERLKAKGAEKHAFFVVTRSNTTPGVTFKITRCDGDVFLDINYVPLPGVEGRYCFLGSQDSASVPKKISEIKDEKFKHTHDRGVWGSMAELVARYQEENPHLIQLLPTMPAKTLATGVGSSMRAYVASGGAVIAAGGASSSSLAVATTGVTPRVEGADAEATSGHSHSSPPSVLLPSAAQRLFPT